MEDFLLAPISADGKKVLELISIDPRTASQVMASLPSEEQIALVSRQALRDPKGEQELLFLLKDEESRDVVEGLGDRTLFRIMKAQSSTHIGVLSLMNPERIQGILDLDQELFSTRGITDPQAAYQWMVSFLEEEDAVFAQLLGNLDIRVVASAFQDKVRGPGRAAAIGEKTEEEEEKSFPADFLVKLDRGELKPDDLEVPDEETLDVLIKIHLADEGYFNELISIMLREDDLKARTAEEAFDRIHEQVGDMTAVTEEAEEMFITLEE